MGGASPSPTWMCFECGCPNSAFVGSCGGCGSGNPTKSYIGSSRTDASVGQTERVEIVQERYVGLTNRLSLQAVTEDESLSRVEDSSSTTIWSPLRTDQSSSHEDTLESTFKECKRCKNRYYRLKAYVKCAICGNVYHMACVRPPLLKAPSRGFAWACGPCSRAQELKFESRRDPLLHGSLADEELMGAYLEDYDSDHDTEDEVPDALAKEENTKQVRFELDRPTARAKEGAEILLAEKEKQRAIKREESRQRKERECEPEDEVPDVLAKKNLFKRVRFELDEERAEILLIEKKVRRAIKRERSRQRKEREREPEPVKTHKDFYATHRQEQQDKPTKKLIDETEYADPIDSIQQHVDDDDDTISVVSYTNSIASIFSNSAASSTTEFSTISGYSSGDIITASKELVSIFHENEIMLPLYTSALSSPAIGPERLERNLRRLFKTYSAHLKYEATDQLEYLAARLVALKARNLAKSIVQKVSNSPVQLQSVDHEQYSDSSDDEANTYPVNEEALADLIAFRQFLVESEAFTTLQAQLQSFVSPTPAGQLVPEYSNDNNKLDCIKRKKIIQNVKPFVRGGFKSGTWQCWQRDAGETAHTYLCNSDGLPKTTLLLYLLVDLVFLVTDQSLIATGLLEPPLCPSKTRLRWPFDCGDAMFSDVEELDEGGVTELVAQMERSSGIKVLASPHRQYAGNQQYSIPRPDRWLRNGIIKLASVFTKSSKPSPCLPQHSATCTLGSTATQHPVQQQILHLMACMHRDPLRKFVQQDRIEDLTTDRELLCFMRQKHVRQRRAFFRLLSLKCIKGIYFVKFWLPIGGSVDVRPHGHCSEPCDCIPPLTKVETSASAEYNCSPIPPKARPPIPPEYLAMLFYRPSEAGQDDVWVLNQLPKRTCGQLQGAPGEPAEGWGIYYHESWDRDRITLAVFIILVLATLLFGVLWSKYQFDVQGAFGVSAWMATLGGILIALLVPQLEKMA